MANRICFESETSHYAEAGWLSWEQPSSQPSSSQSRAHHCWSCTAKVPKLSSQAETRSLQQRKLCDNYNFGTATSDHGLKWAWVKILQCKKVKLQSCRERPVFWMQSSFESCLHCQSLTFHGQWHIFQVRSQPVCKGSFVCLGSNRSLANRGDATVEVVLARSQSCPPKLRPDLYNKEGYVPMRQLQLWDSFQRAWSKTVLSKDFAVQKSEAAKL